jgi:uncharacterized protein YcfL
MRATMIVALLLLIGCADTNRVSEEQSKKPLVLNQAALTTYILDGHPIECIEMFRKLSCNWEKYNKGQIDYSLTDWEE